MPQSLVTITFDTHVRFTAQTLKQLLPARRRPDILCHWVSAPDFAPNGALRSGICSYIMCVDEAIYRKLTNLGMVGHGKVEVGDLTIWFMTFQANPVQMLNKLEAVFGKGNFVITSPHL